MASCSTGPDWPPYIRVPGQCSQHGKQRLPGPLDLSLRMLPSHLLTLFMCQAKSQGQPRFKEAVKWTPPLDERSSEVTLQRSTPSGMEGICGHLTNYHITMRTMEFVLCPGLSQPDLHFSKITLVVCAQ